MNITDFLFVSHRMFEGVQNFNENVNVFLSDERTEVFNKLAGNDKHRFFICSRWSDDVRCDIYFLCDKEESRIVKIYDGRYRCPEMVQVYEDAITYMEKRIKKKYG